MLVVVQLISSLEYYRMCLSLTSDQDLRKKKRWKSASQTEIDSIEFDMHVTQTKEEEETLVRAATLTNRMMVWDLWEVEHSFRVKHLYEGRSFLTLVFKSNIFCHTYVAIKCFVNREGFWSTLSCLPKLMRYIKGISLHLYSGLAVWTDMFPDWIQNIVEE